MSHSGDGDIRFGRAALAQGCAGYIGITGAQRMRERVRQKLAGGSGQVIQASMEAWDYPRFKLNLT